MEKVYICSPLSGDIPGNQAKARRYCDFALRQNRMPLAPHIYFTQFLDDRVPAMRALGLRLGLDWLRECSEVWCFGNHISSGMRAELRWAAENGLSIRCFTEDCLERPSWANDIRKEIGL